MRNQGLNTSRSGFPVLLPREWGRLVSVQKMDATNYSMFLQNDAGEIYIVNLIQRGQYFDLNTYDNGGTALVIRRGPWRALNSDAIIDQLASTACDVGEGAEAVDLQFVDEVGRVERPERRESRMGRSLRDSIVRSIAK